MTEAELILKSRELRIAVIKMLAEAGSGHAGGALGAADIFTFLYFNFLKHDPTNPNWKGRDYFLISNGHIVPIWYAALAYSGYFPITELSTLRKLGSRLQGHPLNIVTPGIFNSSGPLAHGITQATGVALGLKLDQLENRVYCYMSDGEQDEGAIWENMLIANKYKLNNLTLILDLNKIQIDGDTKDIMPLPDLAKVYETCGFNVITIDGNNQREINQAFNQTSPLLTTKPNLIIANTIPGKGVSFMENSYEWHDWKGTPEIVAKALAELQY